MDTIWELRGRVIPALTLWTSTTARARSTTFLRHRGCLHSSTKPRRSLPRWVRSRTGCGIYFGAPWLRRFERGLGASSLSCGPRKRLPHLLRPLVRPPALSRGRAWRVGTFGLGILNTRPFPRPAPKLVMQLGVQLPPFFAAGALFVHPIFAAPIARCAGAGDWLHLSEQADR